MSINELKRGTSCTARL